MKARNRGGTDWQAVFFELVRLGISPKDIPDMLACQVNWLMAELAKRRQAEHDNISTASSHKFGAFNVVVLNPT